MDKLANEDHTHIATEEELNLYRSNWWIRSNSVARCPEGIALISEKRCQLCVASRRIKLITQTWFAKLFLFVVAMANFLVASLIWDITRDDGLDFDGAGEPAETVNGLYLFVEWFSRRTWCTIYSDYIGNIQRKFAVTDGRCKGYTSQHRKLTTETLQLQHEQRHVHWGQAWDQPHQQQVQLPWTRARCTSLEQEHKRTTCHTLWCRVTCTSWFQSEFRHLSSMYMCVSPWVHLSLLPLRLVLPCLLLFLPLPALRGAHLVRQSDRHAKPAQLREQGEWRRLRRPLLPHNVDGTWDLSDSWTGFNQLTLLELTREQLISRPDHLWPEFWEEWDRMPSWRRSRSGLMKSSFLITH